MKFKNAYRVIEINDKGIMDKDEPLLINCAGYYEFDEPSGVTHRKYGRDDYLLSYNHSGLMKVYFDNQYYEIGDRTIIIYKPGEEQYYGQSSNQGFENYWVHFTGYGVTDLLIQANLWEGHIFQVGINHDIIPLFEAIINETAEQQHNFELVTASLLQQLLFLISRKLFLDKKMVNMSARGIDISKSLAYLHKNFPNNITVTELAGKIGLSPSRYSSVFKEYMGLSPQQYLINYRLQKAKDLLRHTNLSIKHIASLVGFNDQLYFSKLFKKYEKVSPLHYKQKFNAK